MKMDNKKMLANFELLLIIVSIFSFSHIYSVQDDFYFRERVDENNFLRSVFGIFVKEFKNPIFGIVSAGTGVGCCELAVDGTICATTTIDKCAEDSLFAEDTFCDSTSFCQRGCCYDEDAGIYDLNVLEDSCSMDWVPDPNCNLPGAGKGCCVLGDLVKYETLGQCETDTDELALGEEGIDWRPDLGEGQCVALGNSGEEGACVFSNGNCKLTTGEGCLNIGGDFSVGNLCTALSLGTECERTSETMCVEGRYGVYFVDSCGNRANIYDSKRANDQNYWEKIILPENSCGAETKDGNANSKTCGNCDFFEGGLCSSALTDKFNPDIGDYYCRDISCTFKGEDYENGESWCVYDGAIGNGNDVVGSRHWKYVCNQGSVQVEPCADYRNEICVQQNTEQGGEVIFRNANCAVNNWRECIDLNTKKGGIARCNDAINCRVQKVNVDGKFDFDVCTPEYPPGFDLRDTRSQSTSSTICGVASNKCTVVRKPKFLGGCEIDENEDCLTSEFGEKMNNLCTSLGDCGGAVNIKGDFQKNYKIRRSGDLPSSYINKLIAMQNPVKGDYAKIDIDYFNYLESSGVIEGIINDGGEYFIDGGSNLALGVAGISSLAAALGEGSYTLFYGIASGGLFTSPSWLAGFANAAVGVAAGSLVGQLIAEELDLNPVGTVLMMVGGSLTGGALTFSFLTQGWSGIALGPWGWAGIAIMIVASFFGSSDCDPIQVEFECKVWQPPRGGEKCEECNNDPLKPCSKYRCESLGATCELVNVGTDNELCRDAGVDDSSPPVLEPQIGIISEGQKYSNINENGFRIASLNDKCIPAYTPVTFGVTSDELSLCRFDLERREFSDMSFDFGGNFYLYNHTITFPLPDPSHGQSKGSDWDGELTLYVKCSDPSGHETPGFYNIEMCVSQGTDVTPPRVSATEPKSSSLVSFDLTSTDVSIITNELSTCKWSDSDLGYSLMTDSLTCDTDISNPGSPFGYLCSGTLNLGSGTTTKYVRCSDQPWFVGSENESKRNMMSESFVYSLVKPDKKIEIDSVLPSEDFEIPSEFTTVNLEVLTSGGGDLHKCSYSFSGYENMIAFFETGVDKTHKQPLNLGEGNHEIFVECKDETRDSARGSTNFVITQDTGVPEVARVWAEEGEIFILTEENAECRYDLNSCNFDWSESVGIGTETLHVIDSQKGRKYYVKCRDEFGNAPVECSIVVAGV